MKRKITCSLCLAKDKFITRYKLPGFDVVECKKCHLLTRNIILDHDELKNIYSRNYFFRLQKDYFSAGISQDFDSSLRVKDFQERLKKISKISDLTKGKLLDLGAGTGVFLKIAKKNGWDVAGVEISPFATGIARKKFNINLFRGELKNAKFKEKSFDVVTAWDLIEHVENPDAIVVRVKKLLKPGGYFFLQTTTADSLLFQLAGLVYRLSLGKVGVLAQIAYPIHHANHFDRKTIIKLLESHGFKIVEKVNVEMYYEETSLSKVFLPILKLIGLIAKMTGRTIEVFVAARSLK